MATICTSKDNVQAIYYSPIYKAKTTATNHSPIYKAKNSYQPYIVLQST